MRSIVFVVQSSPFLRGSAFLRGPDLCRLLSQSGLFNDASLSITADASDVKDSILFVTKGSIESFTAGPMQRARANGNRLIADPLDGIFKQDHLAQFDGVIASSHRQFEALNTSLSGRCHLIAPHLDGRIRRDVPPPEHFAMGYFGELYNTLHSIALIGLVDFYKVATFDSSRSTWIKALDSYSAHYLLRAPDPTAGDKPFTKGVIAAHRLAPVIVGDDDKEALFHLGEDYPYRVNGHDLLSVRAMLHRMKDEFHTPVWWHVRERMAQVRDTFSDTAIAQQFLRAIRALG